MILTNLCTFLEEIIGFANFSIVCANLSQDSSGKKIDLTPEENQTAIDGTKALGLGIAEATGVNVAKLTVEYAKSLVNSKP